MCWTYFTTLEGSMFIEKRGTTYRCRTLHFNHTYNNAVVVDEVLCNLFPLSGSTQSPGINCDHILDASGQVNSLKANDASISVVYGVIFVLELNLYKSENGLSRKEALRIVALR